MKHLPLSLLFAGALLGFPAIAESQISNDDSSSQYLALQCTVSSGRTSSDYQEYGRKLARTLGLLDQAQQKRVFGYVPTIGSKTSVPTTDAGGTTSSAPSSNGDPDIATDPVGSPASGDGGDPAESSNWLLDLIDNLNDSLSGGTSSPDPIIGGTPPVDPETPPTEPETPPVDPDTPPTEPVLTGPDAAFMTAYNEWVAGLSPAVANSTKKFKEAFKAEFNEEYEDVFHEPYKDDSKAIDKKAEKLLK